MAAKITVNPNGPFKVEGEFEVFDAQGKQFHLGGKSVVFLCRCGQSSKMPFCDGTHKSCGFVSPSDAGDVMQA